MIKELGGWPVAEREWVEPEWPIEHLLGKLKGDYNQGVCIEIWVGADDKNSSVNVIQVRKIFSFKMCILKMLFKNLIKKMLYETTVIFLITTVI